MVATKQCLALAFLMNVSRREEERSLKTRMFDLNVFSLIGLSWFFPRNLVGGHTVTRHQVTLTTLFSVDVVTD